MRARSRRPKTSRHSLLWLVLAGCILAVLFLGTLCWIPKQHPSRHYRRILEGGSNEKDTYCDNHFGIGWMAHWNSTAKALCPPGSDTASSQMTCRSMNDDHMTNASKPHVLCNAQKLIVNPAKTLAAACPKHRPKYLCTFGETYNRYLPGAFGLACTSTALQLEDFPRDHLQDIMESFVTLPWDAATQGLHREGELTLLVTREVTEHANVFHTLTDLLNVYISLRMLNLESHRR
ncbi:hypothetical protein ABBQ32_009147 [Trebouxia sp. C0010 RCD-2024]